MKPKAIAVPIVSTRRRDEVVDNYPDSLVLVMSVRAGGNNATAFRYGATDVLKLNSRMVDCESVT